MINLKQILSIILFLFCISSITKAQDTSGNHKASHFKLAASYLTNSVYNGRKDSTTLPYLTPSFGYFDKSGFYVKGSISYLAASGDSRIDLFSLETGYDFTISDKLYGGIYGSKYFYNNSSTGVRSETKGALGGSLSYDPGFITVSSGIDVSFASKTDINFSGSLAHGFYFGDDGDEWSITPTITVNAGSQNAYQDYVKKRKSKGVSSTAIQTNSSNFSILDYELSLPFAYDTKKWGLFFTPTYAIPQNPISIASSTGSGFTTEKLTNVFYAELGAYLIF